MKELLKKKKKPESVCDLCLNCETYMYESLVSFTPSTPSFF